jgi:hypothetical protein
MVDKLARNTRGFFASVRAFGQGGGLSTVLWSWSDPTRITITAVVGAAYLLILSVLSTPETHTLWSTVSVWLLVLLYIPSVLHSLAMLGLEEEQLQRRHDSHGRQRPILAIMSSIVLFAGIYAVMNSTGTGEGDFGLQLKHARGSMHAIVEALYLSVTVATTTGFGDVTPSSISGYLVFALHQLIGWVNAVALLGHVLSSLLPMKQATNEPPPTSIAQIAQIAQLARKQSLNTACIHSSRMRPV